MPAATVLPCLLFLFYNNKTKTKKLSLQAVSPEQAVQCIGVELYQQSFSGHQTMADVTDISPYTVGETVQYYISYLGAPAKWYSGAVVSAITPPTNHTNYETFDISSTIICRNIQGNVRKYRERELKVGQICEYIISTDEDGNTTATLPYTIVAIQADGALVLNFTQRGMHADHLHKLPPDINPFITLIMALNPVSMMVLICIVMIVCTDNVISHDETG